MRFPSEAIKEIALQSRVENEKPKKSSKWEFFGHENSEEFSMKPGGCF